MDFKSIAYVVNDGFQYVTQFSTPSSSCRFGDGIQASPEGLLSLASPTNLFIWNMTVRRQCFSPQTLIQELLTSLDRSASSLNHIYTLPISRYESEEPKERLARMDTFSGTCGRTCFESTSWSPLGLSDTGASILAVSIHSDKSVHFKLFRYVTKHISIELVEHASLMELLRTQWLSVPLFGGDGSRKPITEEFPSLSMCLEGFVEHSFVRWCPTRLSSDCGVLVTAWGCVVFVWAISGPKCTVIGCMDLPASRSSRNPIGSVQVSQLASVGDGMCQMGVTVALVDGLQYDWTVTVSSGIYIQTATATTSAPAPMMTLAKPLGHKQYASNSIAGGVSLAACSSANNAFDFILRRTSRSVQIFRTVAPELQSVSSAISLLLIQAIRTRRPLMDIAAAITDMYKARPGKIAPLETNTALTCMIERLTHEPCTGFALPDGALGIRLAMGLHHLHSRIDPIAASAGRTRRSERKALIELMGLPTGREVKCVVCSASCTTDEEVGKATCVGNPDHVMLLCQLTMDPIFTEPALECCFCRSVIKMTDGMKPVAACPVCRIGVTNSIG